ncbi:multi-sensor signal transduction histidine kinase [Dolichospermum compactum NIES-806]|uniref:Multi-sensor signal transduction histidine kinase n=1 Tax=Dolichospermum compactum NIES-806 TaxID=1973481 RepID=A0A1Z4UY64_9CYAN|nr:Hpt domain-containing protein [Dolichospermum compactum]BAZ84196.1 multi-sensor signal transduction histidine kinase [Dolichospermum compactum NIES-806]
MQPEQQRILGYFLEEAREHLNTIEQGLLNLQRTLEDSEMINEVFRAAHSIKGDAAMLGLSSIQHTSHRLEDCFKILKEHPIQVDQRLESLLLDICDTLKALIDNLGNPFGLSEEKAQALMAKTEPIMQWLNEHIELLVKQGNNEVLNPHNASATRLQIESPVSPQIQNSPVPSKQNQDWTQFQTQVLQILREMLQQFKKTNLETSRNNLQECCHQLAKIGRELNLSNWCNLCESAALAISNPDNSYLTLAKIIITEIKQAQELVLQHKDTEITISQQLENLFPLTQLELLEFEETEPGEILFTDTTEINLKSNRNGFIDPPLFDNQSTVIQHSPSELNTLADLFEGDTPDLEDNWQQEEILEDVTSYQLQITNSEVEDNNHNLADFLFFEDDNTHKITANNHEDLSLLFDDSLLESGNIAETVSSQLIETSNLLSNQTDLQFPSDDVLLELISISRESRQLNSENETNSSNNLEELLTFTADDELIFTDETTESKNIAISEIVTESPISFDNSFLSANADINSPAENIPTTVKISKIKPSAPESLSLDNSFTKAVKPQPPLVNEIDDLFSTPEITTNLANSVDDPDNFWDDLGISDSENTSVINQDIAKELEESLFSASVEIGTKYQQATTNNHVDKKEFDLTSQEQEQYFDLFFTSDSDTGAQAIGNLFSDVIDAESNNVSESRELFLPEINNFSQPPEITAEQEIFEPVEEFP